MRVSGRTGPRDAEAVCCHWPGPARAGSRTARHSRVLHQEQAAGQLGPCVYVCPAMMNRLRCPWARSPAAQGKTQPAESDAPPYHRPVQPGPERGRLGVETYPLPTRRELPTASLHPWLSQREGNSWSGARAYQATPYAVTGCDEYHSLARMTPSPKDVWLPCRKADAGDVLALPAPPRPGAGNGQGAMTPRGRVRTAGRPTVSLSPPPSSAALARVFPALPRLSARLPAVPLEIPTSPTTSDGLGHAARQRAAAGLVPVRRPPSSLPSCPSTPAGVSCSVQHRHRAHRGGDDVPLVGIFSVLLPGPCCPPRAGRGCC